jgi:GntR family transcriptional regulator
MADMGRQARSEILEMMPQTLTETAPQPLHNHLGQHSLRLVRLRFGDEEPIGLQCSTIITELCPDLATCDFEQGSLYDILARRYNLVISKIHYTVNAIAADQFQAELLQVSEGEPLLLVNTTTFLDTGQVIEYTTSYYRADKYEYSTTHTYCA